MSVTSSEKVRDSTRPRDLQYQQGKDKNRILMSSQSAEVVPELVSYSSYTRLAWSVTDCCMCTTSPQTTQ